MAKIHKYDFALGLKKQKKSVLDTVNDCKVVF